MFFLQSRQEDCSSMNGCTNGNSLGVHIRRGDQEHFYNLTHMLDFVDVYRNLWNIETMFIAVVGRKPEEDNVKHRYSSLEEPGQVVLGTSPLCPNDDFMCVVYDQVKKNKKKCWTSPCRPVKKNIILSGVGYKVHH